MGNEEIIALVRKPGVCNRLGHPRRRRLLSSWARRESGMPLRIVDGVAGIAATDPYWDGSACGKAHDIHENVAYNIIPRQYEEQRQQAHQTGSQALLASAARAPGCPEHNYVGEL